MSAKTLDLRNLTPSERDSAINEAVAVMAGYRKVVIAAPSDKTLTLNTWWPTEDVMLYTRELAFATSCDAVMPLLEKAFTAFQWNVSKRAFGFLSDDGMWSWATEQGPFPLAACIALLRANGWEVLT